MSKHRKGHGTVKPHLQLRFERRLFLLVAGLAKQREHIALIALNTGLVEGIDTKHVTAECTGLL